MNNFIQACSVVASGVFLAYVTSFPIQAGLNFLAALTCQGNKSLELVMYPDRIFGGRRIACVPRQAEL
jgi:hypothetical protein